MKLKVVAGVANYNTHPMLIRRLLIAAASLALAAAHCLLRLILCIIGCCLRLLCDGFLLLWLFECL